MRAIRIERPAAGYFGPAYAVFYRWLIPPEQNEAEARFLIDRLRPRPGARWLDAPCGYGRHLAPLRGLRPDLRLSGGDLNRDYLLVPEVAASAPACQCDLARLPFADGSFHVVLNLLNSFGYRGGDGGGDRRDRRVLAELARVARRGGRLVLDLPNRRAVLATVRAEPIIRYGGAGLEAIERFAWDRPSQCLVNRTSWRWPGGSEEARYRLRLYTPAQARRLIEGIGLGIESMMGDFRGGRFDPHRSDRMLIVARKNLN